MKQLKQAHQAPKFRDVMDSGSFSAPMERWVSLAAAVSRAEFEVATSRRDKWMKKLFESYELEVGDFDGLARELRSKGMKRLLYDIRANPGGPLTQAIKVSGEFLPRGAMVVSTKGRVANSSSEYRACRGRTNSTTASATAAFNAP